MEAGLPRGRKMPRWLRQCPRPCQPAAAEHALTHENQGAGGPRGQAKASCSALNILQGRVPPKWDLGRGRMVMALCPPRRSSAPRPLTGGFVMWCDKDWSPLPHLYFPASFASLWG